MRQNKTMKAAKQKQSWGPVFNLMKTAKFPWGLYLLSVLIGLAVTRIFREVPMMESQILGDEAGLKNTALLTQYALFMVAQMLVVQAQELLNRYKSALASRRLRSAVWKKVVHLPMSEIDRANPTTYASRVLRDTLLIEMGVAWALTLLNQTYSLYTNLMMVNSISAKMMWMLLCLIPFTLLAMLPGRFMHNAMHAQYDRMADYTSYVAERMGSIAHIKAFNAEGKEDGRHDAAAIAHYKQLVKMVWLNLAASPLNNVLNAVEEAIVLIFGGYLVSQGELQNTDIIALYSYGMMVYSGATIYASSYQTIKQAQGASRTVSDLMQVPDEVLEREQSFAVADSSIRLENVSFDYGNGVKVLDNLNLTIPQGEVTAIVGPSGSGKTTVLKLLERIYTPTGGAIWFGKDKAESIHLNEWRASFSMVPQNSPLLFGTIRENITYGVEGQVGEKSLNEAIAAANVDEMLQRMPNGLDTEVGDVGDRLSGGERQRIALARMMIRDPDYLLLDEATSALDAENEYEVIEALQKLMAGRTTVVVAHNLRTIERADKIVFMEHGRIVDQGTHEELLQSSPKYRRYVELQRA